jgi:hypothetical protein
MAWNPRRLQCGPREPNIFRPVIRQPPSTRLADVVDSATGMSLPTSACPEARMSPSATYPMIRSASHCRPMRYRSAAMPTQ